VKLLPAIAAMSVLVACHRSSGFEEIGAHPMAGGSGVTYGDCREARKRAAEKPDLEVDRLPWPIRKRPAAFQQMPSSVKSQVDRKGAVVKVDVVVDTLGRADMRTFKVVEVSNPWFADNLKNVLATWRFSPAQLAGCKVPRVYKFAATAKPRA
jgi:hypothetical protein